jgi:hypothetical protein
MNDETTKHENPSGHGNFEHRDLSPAVLFYFFLSLLVFVVISSFVIKGFFAYLDHREKAVEEPVSPLVKKVPEDTRHVTTGYPETAFPSPRLEEDERGQLNSILTNEDNILYSYGWVDEKAGVVRIPIDRAMDLLVQRGLPVRPQGLASQPASAQAENNQKANQARGAHGKVSNQ